MNTSQIKTLLEDIIDISEQVGIIRGQRMCHGYSTQDAIIEHGLRSILHEKGREVLQMTVENWQPIHTLTPEILLTNVVDVWSKRHGRITDVTHGVETYGQGVAGRERGIVYQSYYDCNGPVYEVVKDATHWMIVKGPEEVSTG